MQSNAVRAVGLHARFFSQACRSPTSLAVTGSRPTCVPLETADERRGQGSRVRRAMARGPTLALRVPRRHRAGRGDPSTSSMGSSRLARLAASKSTCASSSGCSAARPWCPPVENMTRRQLLTASPRHGLVRGCERKRAGYIFGLAGHPVPLRRAALLLRMPQWTIDETGKDPPLP